MGSSSRTKGAFTSPYTGQSITFKGSSMGNVRKKGNAWLAQQEALYNQQLLRAQQDAATATDRAALRAEEAASAEKTKADLFARESTVTRKRARASSLSLLQGTSGTASPLNSLLGG